MSWYRETCATGIALLTFAACVREQPTSQVNITRGSLALETDAVYKATVSLDANGEPYCTGAIFNKRTIITAAHCIKGTPSGVTLSIGFGSKQTGKKESITFDRAQMLAHPNWNSSDINSSNIDPLPQIPKNDIGIVVLNQDAPAWTQASFIKMIGPVNVGDRVLLSGFGRTQNLAAAGFDPNMEYRGLLRTVETELEAINAAGWELVYKPLAQLPNGGSCHGDSGGPMYFKEQNGSITLIGITSRSYNKQEDCNGRGIYTDARKFEGWINSQSTEMLKELGPSVDEWQHRYLDAKDGTKISIDYQLIPKGSEKLARVVWLNISNNAFTGSEKVNVQLSSYINSLLTQKSIAQYAGEHRFSVRMTQFENKTVCSPYTRWGISQDVVLSVNGKMLESNTGDPNKFSFLFCQ
jgi:hypothetical protein